MYVPRNSAGTADIGSRRCLTARRCPSQYYRLIILLYYRCECVPMYMVYLLYVDDGRRLERCYRHVFRTRWTQQIRRNHGKIIPLHELNTRQQVSYYYYYYCIHAAAAIALNSQYYFFSTHTYTSVLTGPVQLK